MMLDDRGVRALGKVSEQRKLAELAARRRAVRALARRRELRHGADGGLRGGDARCSPPTSPAIATCVRDGTRRNARSRRATPLALAAGAARGSRSTSRCARGWPRTHASAPSASRGRASPPRCSTATSRRSPSARRRPALGRAAVRYGLRAGRPAAADPRRAPAQPAGRPPSPPRAAAHAARAHAAPRGRWLASTLAAAVLAALALQRVGVTRVAALAGGLQTRARGRRRWRSCAPRCSRARSPGTRSSRLAPTWRRAKRRDAMQGTFIGVLMSATLPARLGEPSRALIVARRLGRARETLPLVPRHDRLADDPQPARAGAARAAPRSSSADFATARAPRRLLLLDRPRAARGAADRAAIAPVLVAPGALSRLAPACGACRRGRGAG